MKNQMPVIDLTIGISNTNLKNVLPFNENVVKMDI